MWLIYALGGGWGHLTRAAALARAAVGVQVRIITNSPHATAVGAQLPEASLRIINPAASKQEARAIVEEELSAAPSRFIVDAFARGLGGELAELLPPVAAPKVLIHRDVNPRYAARIRDFAQAHYTLILAPGEGEAFPSAVRTAPWLVRSHAELPVSSRQGVFVCASGRPDEAAWYREAAAQVRRAGVPVRESSGEWPAIQHIAESAAVIGGGGYNTVYECQALGAPLIARPWPRQYDRQALRIARAGATPVDTPQQAAAAALEALARGPAQPPRPFPNGAQEAAALIARANVRKS
ncbi:MAG: hypothetical protein JSU00_11225 [Acidobacteria bacterium]|nr:hypothetical protein [Acidobacteriota bacterium]